MSRYFIPALAILCLTPWMPSAAALVLGIAIAVSLGNPYSDFTKKNTHRLLQGSVIGLGAGMNLETVARVGLHGFVYTVIGISLTILVGFVLAKLLKVEKEAGILITVGTAICGGSAIAAIAPTIRAKPHSISVALGTVFLLNAIALVIFPPLGHFLNLTETQFGLWGALAIHDTSSVVGATMQYGQHALEIGTTVKLARALWIVPLAFASSYLFSDKENKSKPKFPWFILGFIVVAAIVTWVPNMQVPAEWVSTIAKRTLVLTLFFIGLNLTLSTLKSVGVKPLVHGFVLWLIVGSATALAVVAGWIS